MSKWNKLLQIQNWLLQFMHTRPQWELPLRVENGNELYKSGEICKWLAVLLQVCYFKFKFSSQILSLRTCLEGWKMATSFTNLARYANGRLCSFWYINVSHIIFITYNIYRSQSIFYIRGVWQKALQIWRDMQITGCASSVRLSQNLILFRI